MTEFELIKALPGGGTIAAFIVIVILFLRHEEKVDTRVDLMTKMFSVQINQFVGDMLDVTQETTAAIKGLEDAVRELRTQIKER